MANPSDVSALPADVSALPAEASPPAADAAAPRELTRLEQAGFLVPALWMVTGLFLDGWSHRHQRPETFFTPWHATLYSGFAAGVVWAVWSRYRIEQEAPDLARRPVAGQNVTYIGLALFAIGAPLDFAWHQAFGIESSIKALMSPTHLLLMTGGVLMATGPLRAAWVMSRARRPGWAELFPAIASLALAVAVVSFFLQELSAFTYDSIHFGVHGNAPDIQQMGIGAILVTNALLIGAWLVLARRWRLPFGTATVTFSIVAFAMTGLDSFHRLPLVLGAVAGGLAADVLNERGRSPWVVATVAPAVMWLVWVGAYAAAWGVGWHVDLWLGTVFFTSLTGLGLAVLTFPPAVPALASTQEPAGV